MPRAAGNAVDSADFFHYYFGMRFQKLLIFFLVVSLSLSLAIVAQARTEANDTQEFAQVKNDAASDRLLETLRDKQSELDAKENTASTKAAASSVKKNGSVIQKLENTTTITAAANAGNDLTEILRRKQAELDAKETSGKKQEAIAVAPKSAKSVMEVEQVRPPQVKANIATPAVVVSQPAVAPETPNRLVEVLRDKQAELDAQEGRGSKQEMVPIAPKSVQAAAPKVRAKKLQQEQPKVNAPESQVVVAQPALTPQAQDQLVEVLRKKQAELDAKAGINIRAVRPVEKPSVSTNSKQDREKRIREIEAEIKAKEESFKKAAANKPAAKKSAAQPKALTKKEEAMKAALNAKTPASPQNALSLLPGSKEARLDELLRKYKADEITPHEYHSERAKIIAEP